MEESEILELLKDCGRLTRYYPDGDFRTLNAKASYFTNEYESPEHWYRYNSTYRFGQALFVDGVCIYKGINHSPLALERYAAAELAIVNAEREKAKEDGERWDGQS